MKKEDVRFAIDQLRKDKLIYATEATATSLLSLLGLICANLYLKDPARYLVSLLLLLISLLYSAYMGIGNFLRLRRIKKLEKELK